MKKYIIFGALGLFAIKAFSRTRQLMQIDSAIVNVRNVKLSLGYTTADIDIELFNRGSAAVEFNAGSGGLVKLVRVDIFTKSGKEIGVAHPQNVVLKMLPGGTQRINNIPVKINSLYALEAMSNIEDVKNAEIKLVLEVAGQLITV